MAGFIPVYLHPSPKPNQWLKKMDKTHKVDVRLSKKNIDTLPNNIRSVPVDISVLTLYKALFKQ